MDSVACAIAYSFFATQQAGNTRQYIPLVLTAREDLFLRPENILALSNSAVATDELLCLDDIPSSRLSTLGVSYALVDHNKLLPMFGTAQVVSILDHHADEGCHLDASPRILQTTGSCSSLVTTYFSTVSSPLPIPGPLADLLLSALLVDTSLKPTPDGKATPTDLSAVESLLPTSSLVGAQPSDSVLALSTRGTSLLTSKSDVGWMNPRDLLRRDYKEYEIAPFRYGLATVPVGFGTWLDKGDGWNGVRGDVEAWIKERDLSMVGVLTSYNAVDKVKKNGKGKHERELLVYVQDARLEEVLGGLEKEESLRLGVWNGGEVEETEGGKRWRVWQQGNVKATRKQVAPVVSSIVRTIAARL